MIVAACTFAGCTPSRSPTPTTPPATKPSSRQLTTADAASCPVTKYGSWTPPTDVYVEPTLVNELAFGNGKLWVFGTQGILYPLPEQISAGTGTINWKFPWFRATKGQLEITGRRLDAPAPPLEFEPNPFYGDIGFQPSGVGFPTEGCWELTGKVGDTSITFVVFVIR
jgi:hypothetical protein